MVDFVLVHGAWHGGWCWRALEPLLQAQGHATHAIDLTGLGARSHLLSAEITAATHVLDVVNYIKWHDLKDVCLVGHSYGGNVITGAAGQVPEAIASMVYLDAQVPFQSGYSLQKTAQPERWAGFQKQIDAGAMGVQADLYHLWSDDPDTIAWLKTKCTPHPAGCMTSGVTLTGRETEIARKLYILASRNKGSIFWAERDKVANLPGWSTSEIDSMHDAMIDAPEALAALLLDFAQEA